MYNYAYLNFLNFQYKLSPQKSNLYIGNMFLYLLGLCVWVNFAETTANTCLPCSLQTCKLFINVVFRISNTYHRQTKLLNTLIN